MTLKDLLPFIAISVSLVALYFAVRNYRRKSGIHIRGQFGIISSAYAEDKYVSSITLENFKDRSVIIFKIFLRIGSNYYIEIDDFESEPKILKSYESFTNNYGPVDFYSCNLNRIKLNKLLDSKKAKLNIVLSTSHGKYVVKEWIDRWDPVFDFFRNHMTACIIPMKPAENSGYFGSDFKYLVKLHTEDGYKKTIPVYSYDINRPRFEKFSLTAESLSSKESLENFLTEQAIDGNLKCVDIEVIDAEQMRTRNYGHSFEKVYEAEYYSRFTYLVLGRLLTIWSNIQLYFINRKNKKTAKIFKRENR